MEYEMRDFVRMCGETKVVRIVFDGNYDTNLSVKEFHQNESLELRFCIWYVSSFLERFSTKYQIWVKYDNIFENALEDFKCLATCRVLGAQTVRNDDALLYSKR